MDGRGGTKLVVSVIVSRKGDESDGRRDDNKNDVHYPPVQRGVVDGAGARSHEKPVVVREQSLLGKPISNSYSNKIAAAASNKEQQY